MLYGGYLVARIGDNIEWYCNNNNNKNRHILAYLLIHIFYDWSFRSVPFHGAGAAADVGELVKVGCVVLKAGSQRGLCAVQTGKEHLRGIKIGAKGCVRRYSTHGRLNCCYEIWIRDRHGWSANIRVWHGIFPPADFSFRREYGKVPSTLFTKSSKTLEKLGLLI